MPKKMTEDEVRDKARGILNMENKAGVKSGFGQITSFNQLGFQGVNDKPDGWYLPENVKEVAVVVELKASGIALDDFMDACMHVLLKPVFKSIYGGAGN